MDIRELLTIDKEILDGQTVFKATRVPVESLFDHLEAGTLLFFQAPTGSHQLNCNARVQLLPPLPRKSYGQLRSDSHRDTAARLIRNPM